MAFKHCGYSISNNDVMATVLLDEASGLYGIKISDLAGKRWLMECTFRYKTFDECVDNANKMMGVNSVDRSKTRAEKREEILENLSENFKEISKEISDEIARNFPRKTLKKF